MKYWEAYIASNNLTLALGIDLTSPENLENLVVVLNFYSTCVWEERSTK